MRTQGSSQITRCGLGVENRRATTQKQVHRSMPSHTEVGKVSPFAGSDATPSRRDHASQPSPAVCRPIGAVGLGGRHFDAAVSVRAGTVELGPRLFVHDIFTDSAGFLTGCRWHSGKDGGHVNSSGCSRLRHLFRARANWIVLDQWGHARV